MRILSFIVEFTNVVFFTCKSYKAFSVHVNPERFETCHYHVDSQVEFVTIEKQRVIKVSTYHQRLVLRNLFQIVHNINASTS